MPLTKNKANHLFIPMYYTRFNKMVNKKSKPIIEFTPYTNSIFMQK